MAVMEARAVGAVGVLILIGMALIMAAGVVPILAVVTAIGKVEEAERRHRP